MTDKENNKTENSKPAAKADAKTEKISAANATKIAAQAKIQANAQAKKGAVKSPKTAAQAAVKTKAASKSTTPAMPKTGKQQRSKTAVLALLLAISAGAGVAGHYWWQQQQSTALEQRINTSTTAGIEQLDKHLQQQISTLQRQQQQRISQLIGEVEQRSGSRIRQLEQEIEQLLDSQPHNWQITEAEYLTRMAGRVLWLEKDTGTAIQLIEDADARVKELKDPRMLKIREVLHQDIERLKVLPKLQRDDIILSLMGLSKQIDQLPLATVQLPEETELSQSTALTEDVSDWQQNLAKSWHKFKEEFITIRRRAGNVEPLMAPKLEQNLYHNLALKFQQAQWAVSQGNTELYQASITDIQRWLGQHFDMTVVDTQQFNARLGDIKSLPVNVDYPESLASQQALRAILDNKPKKRLSTPKPQRPMQQAPKQAVPAEKAAATEESKISTRGENEPEGNA
ncbi:uroporphyrinogen-III C-methyltransferase [Thalassotalea sp. ND16A]|uniref:uroporphyrinogen-III C-methyltransferase n=1 Tax=Thalassotalea sp. ND16A TaxID=1535422 RepID=UPI00051A34F5|nr:uroporphyrinogen-III C-methyltransferase [Thalassotalea sp. ND16A]KGJ92224.1 Uroporphyrinogen-III C-methyltransferase [Thalassotalea sp. ND16A]